MDGVGDGCQRRDDGRLADSSDSERVARVGDGTPMITVSIMGRSVVVGM